MLADTTAQIDLAAVLEQLLRPAEVRTAADLMSPLSYYPPRRRAAPVATTAEQSAPSVVKATPWLVDTMRVLEVGRGLATGPDQLSLLDDAELLAALLAGAAPAKRPQLNILEDGRPSFATSTKDLYLHLTVDEPKTITMFAVCNGAEHFHENLPFDGRRLPAEIRNLLPADRLVA